MEDENGLELSLGLSCGGSSGKSKGRDVSLDTKVDDGSSTKLSGDSVAASDVSFKNFFQTSVENQDHQDHNGKQKVDPVPLPHEKFWTDLGKHAAPLADSSNDVRSSQAQFSRYQEWWIPNNKITDTEEEKSGSSKRKLSFEEINLQKKHERAVDLGDAQGKSPAGVNLLKKSHVSVTTEDGSSGENEDVAESEAEGSNSWLASQHEDSSKSDRRVTDKHVLNDQSGVSFQGQKQPSFSGNDSNQEIGKVAYIPLSLPPLTVMTVPYPVPVKVPTIASAPNATRFPSSSVMQLMPLANSERPVIQTMNTSNLPLAFGYSPVQLPTLETNSSWAFGSQPQHASSCATKDNADGASQHLEGDAKSSHAFMYEGKPSDLGKSSGKQIGEAGASSSSQAEEEDKGSNRIFRQKETANQPAAEIFSHGGSAITPGMLASDVKFGGCGSYPELPWVSTTAPGPNGKTISGVTYKYNRNQIKIICACHGSHMTQEEFIQHASGDASNRENNTSLASFPASNPAASAQN